MRLFIACVVNLRNASISVSPKIGLNIMTKFPLANEKDVKFQLKTK